MVEIGAEVCTLLEADRVTIYCVSEDGHSIVSKVKTGLTGFKELALKISPASIAGYVALNKQVLNIANVYDAEELARISPTAHFLQEVDDKTGYHTTQMLVAPILSETRDLLGVVQLINTWNGLPFPKSAVEGIAEVAKTLAIAFELRRSLRPNLNTKFHHLIRQQLISGDEMNLAARAARKASTWKTCWWMSFRSKSAISDNRLPRFIKCLMHRLITIG